MKQLTLSTGEIIDVPETRGDCANIPRPCPFNNCRHHLEGEVPKSGASSLKWWKGVENRRLNMVQESCVLDVVEKGTPYPSKWTWEERGEKEELKRSIKLNKLGVAYCSVTGQIISRKKLEELRENVTLTTGKLSHEKRMSPLSRGRVHRGINMTAKLLGVSKQAVHQTLRSAMGKVESSCLEEDS